MYGMAKPWHDGNQLGLPILDTRNRRVKLSYFDLVHTHTHTHTYTHSLFHTHTHTHTHSLTHSLTHSRREKTERRRTISTRSWAASAPRSSHSLTHSLTRSHFHSHLPPQSYSHRNALPHSHRGTPRANITPPCGSTNLLKAIDPTTNTKPNPNHDHNFTSDLATTTAEAKNCEQNCHATRKRSVKD